MDGFFDDMDRVQWYSAICASLRVMCKRLDTERDDIYAPFAERAAHILAALTAKGAKPAGQCGHLHQLARDMRAMRGIYSPYAVEIRTIARHLDTYVGAREKAA